jgi:hypothetical protein
MIINMIRPLSRLSFFYRAEVSKGHGRALQLGRLMQRLTQCLAHGLPNPFAYPRRTSIGSRVRAESAPPSLVPSWGDTATLTRGAGA